jgi:glycosyltransferase involved in cell wall biosynthesis
MLIKMLHKPEISIIIPVFNRQDLLGFTLDSILGQSFTDWECVLVDDQSTDASFEVMEIYQKKDGRFKICKRPVELKKGANSCRNYGFTIANGTLIKWFDSDDIMLCDHLEIANFVLTHNNLDFVITDTVNFNNETQELLAKPYVFDKVLAEITAMSFATSRIGWITDDFLGTYQLVEKIKFNENITTDGDEYNFFVRLLSLSTKGLFINKILTYRRVHDNSLTHLYGREDANYLLKIANIKYQTAKDLVMLNNSDLIRWFLSGYMNICFELTIRNKEIPHKKEAYFLIKKFHSLPKGLGFLLALYLGLNFKKGYNIMKYARK